MGLVRSTTEQEEKMKEVESWLLKNAASSGFLARQALLIVYLLTLMELLQTAEDQGANKKKNKTTQQKKSECSYASARICSSAIPRENMETVKFPHANDHIQRLI